MRLWQVAVSSTSTAHCQFSLWCLLLYLLSATLSQHGDVLTVKMFLLGAEIKLYFLTVSLPSEIQWVWRRNKEHEKCKHSDWQTDGQRADHTHSHRLTSVSLSHRTWQLSSALGHCRGCAGSDWGSGPVWVTGLVLVRVGMSGGCMTALECHVQYEKNVVACLENKASMMNIPRGCKLNANMFIKCSIHHQVQLRARTCC